MQKSQQDLPQHPIQVVATRTGLTSDVIRAWERRYKVVAPHRGTAGRRLYSDAEIERLLLLRKALCGGRRIGEIARLGSAKLASLVKSDARLKVQVEDLAVGSPESGHHYQDSLNALRSLDAVALDSMLERALLALGTDAFLADVLIPLLNHIGSSWIDGTMGIQHEHLASSVVRARLDSMQRSQARPSATSGIVVTTPMGQHHELGALMASVIAAAEGWRVVYLGPNMPATDICAAVRQTSARVLALSIIYPEGDPGLASELRQLQRQLPGGVAVLVGGRAGQSYSSPLQEIGAALLPDLCALRSELRVLQDPVGLTLPG